MQMKDVKPGTRLRVDRGFTCMPAGSIRVVRRAEDKNGMFVNCSNGKHFLDGQCENGRLIGMTDAGPEFRDQQ